MNLHGRSYEEKIVLIGALLGIVGILPFTLYRYLVGDYVLALLELGLAVVLLGLWTYIWRTHRHETASVILCVVCMAVLTAVVQIKGPELVYWAYPAMLATFCITTQRTAAVLNLVCALFMLPGIYPKVPMVEVCIIYATIAMMSVFGYTFTVVTQKQRLLLSQLAERDALTGTLNRRSLDDSTLIALNQIKLTPNYKCALVILDLDHFKDINDTYGHNIGDQILVRMAELIRSNLRVSDRLYRYGGEEFVLLLDNTGLKDAKRIAENIRDRVEKGNLFDKRGVTISIGVAQLKPLMTAEAWLTLADDALYEAKRSGRNRVRAADDPALTSHAA